MTAPARLPSSSFIELPRDYHAHPDVEGGELWWITSSLRSGDRWFGTQTMLTTIGGFGLTVSTCVADLDRDQREADAQLCASDDATLATDRLEVRAPRASLTGSFEREAQLHAQVGATSAMDLSLRPTAPVIHNCGTGSFPLLGRVTWQFSVPALATSGTVTTPEGTFDVDGWSWLDRQWFDHLDAAALGELAFTWMGLCLDTGDNLSLWDCTVSDPDGRSWVTVVSPDGTHTLASIVPVARDAGDPWTSEGGTVYPRRWTVQIAALDATLEVTSTPLTELPGGVFFTGVLSVSGSWRGEPVRGYGFTDLVGWSSQ